MKFADNLSPFIFQACCPPASCMLFTFTAPVPLMACSDSSHAFLLLYSIVTRCQTELNSHLQHAAGSLEGLLVICFCFYFCFCYCSCSFCFFSCSYSCFLTSCSSLGCLSCSLSLCLSCPAARPPPCPGCPGPPPPRPPPSPRLLSAPMCL